HGARMDERRETPPTYCQRVRNPFLDGARSDSHQQLIARQGNEIRNRANQANFVLESVHDPMIIIDEACQRGKKACLVTVASPTSEPAADPAGTHDDGSPLFHCTLSA